MSHQKGIGITVGGQRPETSERPLRATPGPVGSLYLHVPFCSHKCHYCDFYSFVDSRDRQEPFVGALLAELDAMRPLMREGLKTVFIGGGTPSLLRPDLWARLLGSLTQVIRPGGEFTVECNPESVTPELASVLASGGVNRVSMGAQSFSRDHLRTLERLHDPDNVERALNIVRDAGIVRRNIDLIYAIPGQSIEDWRHDLQTAVGFFERGLIDHVSAYALTYEPNTAMTQRLQMGEFHAAEDALEAEMYDTTVERLAEAGLHRYEVSNFAVPGSECRHNLVYWRCGSWLAAGPSASGHVAGYRWKNVPKLGEWMDGVASQGGYAPVIDLEPPDEARSLSERLMMGLRLEEGVEWDAILRDAERLGRRESLESESAGLIARGQVERRDTRLHLSADGFLWADGIASRLMSALTDSPES